MPPMTSATRSAAVTTRAAGVTQTAIEAPLPAGANQKKWVTLSQVVCPSVTGCVATGGYNLPPASNQVGHLLALSKRGAKWELDATPANLGVIALACPSVGTCVGTARGRSTGVYVVTQQGRSWRSSVVQLRGDLEAAKTFPVLRSASCGSAGNCAAVGTYTTFKPHDVEPHALLVNEKDGIWGAGVDAQLPPDAATTSDVNGDGPGGVATVVSCPSAGNCVAGGTYAVRVGDLNEPAGWVATEQAGEWEQAVSVQLPGGGTAGDHFGTGLSCPSVGVCTVVGGYTDRNGREQGLIAQERRGVWLPGIRAPVPRGGSAPNEPNAFDDPLFGVSCADASDCAAIGAYVKYPHPGGYPGTYHGWLLTERRGAWSASKVVLPQNAKAPGETILTSVSCGARGSCVAVGNYGTHVAHAIIEVERRGEWQRAISPAVPANAAKNASPGLNSVSCSSAHRCTVVGSYKDRSGKPRGLIVNLRIP